MNMISNSSPNRNRNNNSPWVEKYRPLVLDDIVGNTETINRLKLMVSSKNMSNVILIGNSGIGKTSSIHCVARALLGEYYKVAVLEINASEERKVDIVKDDINRFCQKVINLPKGLTKIVILDEVDSMTESAQHVLREIIEKYKNTRFALACNHSSRIIEPIQSRCNLLKFNQLKKDEMKKRLETICLLENITIDESGIEAIVESAEGDMRNLLNNLQIVTTGYDVVNKENVYKICDMPIDIQKILNLCYAHNSKEALEETKKILEKGVLVQDIFKHIFHCLKNDPSKLKYLEQLSHIYIRINEGFDTHLQLYGLIVRLSR